MVDDLLVEFGNSMTVEALVVLRRRFTVIEEAPLLARTAAVLDEPPADGRRHRKSPLTSEIGG
ncbi:hypothetical protein [Haloprofundus salilacus]|uniref:hypothetical protein n=1 Tax=Haloprofundus salilacus TaxID=2876190 RepID=UPI001CC9C0FD|nr:hypothetical protein [Haloprofundus salilacus]